MLSNIRWHRRPFPLHRKPGECDAWARTRPALLSSPLIIFHLPLSHLLLLTPTSRNNVTIVQPLFRHILWLVILHAWLLKNVHIRYVICNGVVWQSTTVSTLKIRIGCYILLDCPNNHNCVTFCLDLICHTIDWTHLCLLSLCGLYNAALVLIIYFTCKPHTR